VNAIVNSEDLVRAAVVESIRNPSEDIARSVLQAAGMSPDTLERSITTGTGLVAYDLQAPAKNLYPVVTPIRNRLPRVGGGIGIATNWKTITAISGSGFDNTGWVPEGQRAGAMSYVTGTGVASYATLGEEDAATFEAINAGVSFEDVQARMTMRLLQKTMLKEEMALLCGNTSLALGTPTTPTLAAAGSGATLPALTYSVIVVALTLEGYRNSSVANGVATSKVVTGQDGKTFTINGGSSQKSAAATQAVTLGQTLSCSVTPVQGAVAYAWYTGAAGSEKLEKITTINSVTFSAPLAGTGQAATLVTADCSRNNAVGAYDGLLTTALKAGSGAYVKSLATGTAGTGTVLTASGRGSVVEIDDMFQNMWDNFQVSPSVLYVNSQQIRNITDKVLSGPGTSPLLQMFKSPEDAYELTAGGTISYYYNPFQLDGGQRIPVKIHPQVAPGTIIGWAENLPIQYQSNEVPNVAEVKVRQDYYQIDWPITTRQRQVGVYVEEVLAVYFAQAMGVINNIAAG
jgi:hypothetical protein